VLLSTCALTTLLWYTNNFVHLIIYITVHSTIQQNTLHCMLPSKLLWYSWVYFQDAHKYTPKYNLNYASNSTQLHIPRLLDSMLPGKLSRSIQVHSKYVPMYTSKDILKYTFEHALNNVLNCRWWYTRSYLCSYLGSQAALKNTSKLALKYVPNCMT
jgi:hypothetical protein